MNAKKIAVINLLMLGIVYQINTMDEETARSQVGQACTYVSRCLTRAGRAMTVTIDRTWYGPDEGLVDAISYNNIQQVQRLLARGVNPDQRGRFTRHRYPIDLTANLRALNQMQPDHYPIDLATKLGYPEATRALLAAGLNPNAFSQDNDGTPLMIGSLYGHPEVVQEVLTAGGNPNIQNQDGTTALMSAVETINPERCLDIVKLLIAHPDIDVNLRNQSKNTALLLAIKNDRTDQAIYLIKHDAEYTQEDQNRVATDQEFNHVSQEKKD